MGTGTTVNEFISPSASEDTASVSRLTTIHKEGLEAKLHMSFYYSIIHHFLSGVKL